MEQSPYKTHRDALIERYGAKTYKLTLAGGRTCPTRDGSFGPKKGWGGCTFCDQSGSASFFANDHKKLSVTEQLDIAAEGVRKRFKAENFIAYFQSYTTTYREIDEAKKLYDEAVLYPGVVALAVGTRPDCVPDAVLDVFFSYLDRMDLHIELGVQSFFDPSLEWYDRGHDSACAIDAIKRIQAKNKLRGPSKYALDLSIHLILGSPLEDEAEVVRQAKLVNSLGVNSVKLHHLHILEKTKLAQIYAKQEFKLFELEEYLELAALFIRHLDPHIVITRTHATASFHTELIGPKWSTKRAYPASRLRALMQKNAWSQGDLL